MTNLTQKQDELENLLTQQNNAVLNLLGQQLVVFSNLGGAVQQMIVNLEQLNTKTQSILDNTNRLSTIQGTLEETRIDVGLINGKMNDANDRLLAIVAALGLIKGDTSNIEPIRTRLLSFLGNVLFSQTNTEIVTLNTKLESLLRWAFAGTEGSIYPTAYDTLQDYLDLMIDNIKNVRGSVIDQGQTTNTNLTEVINGSDAINDNLLLLLACLCQEPPPDPAGFCSDGTILSGALLQGPQNGIDWFFDYAGNGVSSSTPIRRFIRFSNWFGPTNTIIGSNEAWTTTGGAAIYKHESARARIRNNGPATIIVGMCGVPQNDWLFEEVTAGQTFEVQQGVGYGCTFATNEVNPESVNVELCIAAVG